MNYKDYWLAMILVVGLGSNQSAFADGGGGESYTQDPCERTIESHSVKFAAYQGGYGSEKLCHEVPAAGHLALTVDLVDKALRDMKTGVRLIEAGSWSAAQDLGSEGKTITEWPAKTFPTGVVSLEYTLQQPGYFAAVVTLEAADGKRHVLRFPFHVGEPGFNWNNWSLVLLVVVLGGGLYYVLVYKKKPNVSPA